MRLCSWLLPLFLLGGILSSGCAGPRLRIEGADAISERRLKKALPALPEPLSAEGLQGWRPGAHHALREVYESKGFLGVQTEFELAIAGDDTLALVRVFEGEPYAVNAVEVVIPDTSACRIETAGVTQTRSGGIFSREEVLADRGRLARAIGERGCPHARVRERVETLPGESAVRVAFEVDPGPLVLFDTLLIRITRDGKPDGPPGITRPSLLGDWLGYRPGDTVRSPHNDRTLEKLHATGAFHYVRLKDTLTGGPGGHSALVMYGQEKVPGHLRTSLFFDTQFGPGAGALLGLDNALGTLNSVEGEADVSLRKQGFDLRFGSPVTLGYIVRFDQEFAGDWYQNREVHRNLGSDPFDGDFNASAASKLSKSFTHWLRGLAAAEFSFKSLLLGAEDRDRGLTLNYTTTMFFSWLDRRLDPARGLRFAPTWGNGGPFIREGRLRLARFRHNWLEVESAGYFPLSRRFIVAARLDGGRFFGSADLNAERFFLGGSRSVRAFGFRELCPRKNADGACLTKDLEPAFAMGSLELRTLPFDWETLAEVPVLRRLKNLGLVPFADAGAVWDLARPREGQLDGEGWNGGLGLRYPFLGVFNLRLDFALGEDGRGDRAFAWVLDLAQAF